MDVVATGVQINIGDLLFGEPTATAQQVVGTAAIPYATLDDLVKLPGLSLADIHFSQSDGALRFEALGALAPGAGGSRHHRRGGAAANKLRDARFNSRVLPALGKDVLNQILAATIDLAMPALPLGLALQSVTPGPDGLSISVIGHDVPLAADSAQLGPDRRVLVRTTLTAGHSAERHHRSHDSWRSLSGRGRPGPGVREHRRVYALLDTGICHASTAR